jgi:hypothetical protein
VDGTAFGLADSAVILDPQSGRALSAFHQRLAELIADYDDTLELAWIPPEKRLPLDRDKEFAVICRPRDGQPPYVVMKIAEADCNESVLAAIIIRDNAHGNVLDRLEACEFADAAMKAKDDFERAEFKKDFVKTVIKSPLHTFKHDGVKYQ